MRATWPAARFAAAFSLLELLVVLALAAALIAAASATFSSLMQGAEITTAASHLQDVLTDAQHAAMAKNVTVEVRFYAVPGADGRGSFYHALQARALNTDGTIAPLSTLVTLPNSVTLDPTAAHSPLLGSNAETATADPGDPLLNGQTRVFHFLPDGSTDLATATAWFVTVRSATASDPAHFPSNWACVSLNPATGRVQIFRP